MKKDTKLTAIQKENVAIQDEATALISQAINQNVPVESLERLLAMRRELKAEKAKEAFDQALASFQKECPIIEKKTVAGSDAYSYKYATLDQIISQVKDLLSKNGFSYTFDSKKTDHSLITICRVKHVGGHSEVSEFEIEIDRQARMNISQKDGSASTYGKRYAFCNAFGILTGDEDTDAQTRDVKQVEKKESTTVSRMVATTKQINFIKRLLAEKGYTPEQLCIKYNVTHINELTIDQASMVIKNLTILPEKKTKNTDNKIEEITDQDYDDFEEWMNRKEE